MFVLFVQMYVYMNVRVVRARYAHSIALHVGVCFYMTLSMDGLAGTLTGPCVHAHVPLYMRHDIWTGPCMLSSG